MKRTSKLEVLNYYRKELRTCKNDLQKWFECLQKNLIAKKNGVEYIAIEYIENHILNLSINAQRLKEIVDKLEFEYDMEA